MRPFEGDTVQLGGEEMREWQTEDNEKPLFNFHQQLWEREKKRKKGTCVWCGGGVVGWLLTLSPQPCPGMRCLLCPPLLG